MSPGDAGGRLEVPDVGLGRTQPAACRHGTRRADRRGDRLDLDRIAERRAGAVGLDEADARRIELRVRQRLADQGLLRQTVRRREHVSSGRPG